MSEIRKASIADIPRIIELGKEFHSDSMYKDLVEFDENSLAATSRMLITSDKGIIFVTEKDGNIIGGIGALIVPFYFNYSHLFAQHIFWYMSKAFRQSFAGIKLFLAFEEWAGANGAKSILAGCPADDAEEKFLSFFRRRNFKPFETHVIKGVV